MIKKINLKLGGLHCQSCKSLIETEIGALKGVAKISVDLKTEQCQIEFDSNQVSLNKIKNKIESLNYQVVNDLDNEEKKAIVKTKNKGVWGFTKGFLIPVVIIGLIVGYVLIKKYSGFEILSRLNEANVSYWLIFIIGVMASFHCIGMCGGLVVAYTASDSAKNKNKSALPHFQYNLGRTISYTIIGGILGGVGSFFGINPTFTGAITLLAAVFMILMGLSLFTNFKWLKKVRIKTPTFVGRFLFKQKYSGKPKGPFIIGLLNGFMPCGPLQAIQLYALTSGSFTRGALSMAVYALGTVPLMFGFGSFISAISQDRIKKIMKFSGIVVIVLGLFMINRGLTNFGYGLKGFSSPTGTSQTEYIVTGDVEEYQTVRMDLIYSGYSPNILYVKKDIPVRWIIDVKQMSGCTDEIIMPEYNIQKPLEYGENIIEFVPDRLGEIKFSCWMQMVWGKFVVTEDEVDPSQKNLIQEQLDVPQGTSCSGDGSCGGECGQPDCGCKSRIKESD